MVPVPSAVSLILLACWVCCKCTPFVLHAHNALFLGPINPDFGCLQPGLQIRSATGRPTLSETLNLYPIPNKVTNEFRIIQYDTIFSPSPKWSPLLHRRSIPD